jgi:2-oxoglutarate dehydrogenase E2 component (dihydrolipoamide succinyltransferase)
LVLNIAQNEGINLNELQQIPGTGSQGRVSKKDILNYVAQKKAGHVQPKIVAQPALSAVSTTANANNSIPQVQNSNSTSSNTFPPADHGFSSSNGAGKFASPDEVIVTGNTEIIEMDRMRKLIAKHMVESVQTSPHVTSFVEADVTNMVVWREKVKQLFEKREGTKLTFTPMFMECIAKVLEQFPYINCSLQGDNIILKKDINIGMATALPSGNLIVPVIKGANQLSIVGLSKAVNNLANAARNNQLKPQDTQGGTFTVTNVGTFGSIMGTPIIPQPQVAILALGAIKKRPVVIETPSGDAILVRHMMYLSMSYDHRIVDGAMGSSFLSAVAKEFEQWDQNRQWFQYV